MNEKTSWISVASIILAVLMPPIGLIMVLCFRNKFTDQKNQSLMKVAFILSVIFCVIALIGLILTFTVFAKAVDTATDITKTATDQMKNFMNQ